MIAERMSIFLDISNNKKYSEKVADNISKYLIEGLISVALDLIYIQRKFNLESKSFVLSECSIRGL